MSVMGDKGRKITGTRTGTLGLKDNFTRLSALKESIHFQLGCTQNPKGLDENYHCALIFSPLWSGRPQIKCEKNYGKFICRSLQSVYFLLVQSVGIIR